MQTRRWFILGVLVQFILCCTGCAGTKANQDDQQRMETIRRQHAQLEMSYKESNASKYLHDSMPKDIDKPLTLEEAISYSLSYNLDAEVKKLESDILREARVGARLKMLPSLTFEGEISRRDSYDASYSDPLFTSGEQDYNYSRDKSTKKFSLELSWDLLNFGIAYYQQRQAGEQYRIAEQRRLRVVQNLKFDVAKTYWQALAARQAAMKAGDLLERLKERQNVLGRQLKSLDRPEIEILEMSVLMSEIQMQLSGYELEYKRNKERLSTLMGLPPSSGFDLADADFDSRMTDAGVIDMAALETETLLHRPELYEQDLEERISLDDARIAVAGAMPRPSLFYRYNYDGDSHIYEDQWYEMGVRLSFDLLTVPQQRSSIREANAKKRLAKTRRQSVAAAALTQLRLAVIDFEDSKRKYEQAHVISHNRKQLMMAYKRQLESGQSTYEKILEIEAKYLAAEVRSYFAHADLQIAEQRILNTMGSEDAGLSRFLTVLTSSTEQAGMDSEEPMNVEPQADSDSNEMSLEEVDDSKMADKRDTLLAETQAEEPLTEERAANEQIEPEESEMEVAYSEDTLTSETISDADGPDTTIVEKPLLDNAGMDNVVVADTEQDHPETEPYPVSELSSYEGLGTSRPYSIQLFSSRSKNEAMTRLAGFKNKGMKAYLVPVPLKNNGLWWRCYEGSYETPEKANRAREGYDIPESIVMETPYTAFLGQFSDRKAMKALTLKLVSLGYSPYILKREDGVYQLVVGAFYSLEMANQWARILERQGIRAHGVRR